MAQEAATSEVIARTTYGARHHESAYFHLQRRRDRLLASVSELVAASDGHARAVLAKISSTIVLDRKWQKY